MIFLDESHKNFYLSLVDHYCVTHANYDYRCFFYVLSAIEFCREHFEELVIESTEVVRFDLENIDYEGLSYDDEKLLRLGLCLHFFDTPTVRNMQGGMAVEEVRKYCVYDVFALRYEYFLVAVEALKIWGGAA